MRVASKDQRQIEKQTRHSFGSEKGYSQAGQGRDGTRRGTRLYLDGCRPGLASKLAHRVDSAVFTDTREELDVTKSLERLPCQERPAGKFPLSSLLPLKLQVHENLAVGSSQFWLGVLEDRGVTRRAGTVGVAARYLAYGVVGVT
jgi:hypothetical protein